MDSKRIPTFNKKEWKELNLQYDKETIIAGIIHHIRTQNPEPPMLDVSEDEMIKSFFKLKKTPVSKFYLDFHSTQNKVIEKYDDYGHKYSDCGLGVVQMGNSYLDVSNHFNQALRLRCDSYGHISPHQQWKSGNITRNVLLCLWRLGNDKLDEQTIVGCFRNATYIATQFKPHVAKFIYDSTGSKYILDTSCGWGDRLAGFYCSEASHYVGCDPNPEVFDMYKKQCLTYERLLGEDNPKFVEMEDMFLVQGKKNVQIWRKPAEDVDLEKETFDCAFTSPPYFSTELYGKGGEHEKDQSWSRYSSYEKWRDDFYLPVNRNTFESLKPGGIQIVNIQDPKVHGKRYYASDDLIKDLTTKYKDCKFLGDCGMRVMQRAKKIEKEQLLEFFDKIYIEPMWVFGKNRDHFMKSSNGLLDFME